uniref:ZP domain-containing protein n=1 Tax=Parascaris univalens TaxID=6257 RepID=A0A915ATF9_PARUN
MSNFQKNSLSRGRTEYLQIFALESGAKSRFSLNRSCNIISKNLKTLLMNSATNLQILDGGPSGQPIQFATIGQQVYHKWTCDSETVDTFCAVVHSCFVDDGNGDKVEILNSDGCALDKYLLNNLEYPTDLMAGQEAHVYKYADRSQLFYQCQISITIKEPNSECARPQCSEPQGFGAVRSGNAPAPAAAPASPAQLRLLRKREIDYANTLDVRTDIS